MEMCSKPDRGREAQTISHKGKWQSCRENNSFRLPRNVADRISCHNMETAKIEGLRKWVSEVGILPDSKKGLLLEILDAALLARQKAAERLARHRGASTPAKAPKVAQNRGKRPKKPSAADRPIVPPQVQALVAKMEPPPPSEANPVFSMLKSKLPSSVKHNPAATQFKTAKPKKP
jgi:hypothetical protein